MRGATDKTAIQWDVLLPPGPASMLTMEAEVVAYSFNNRMNRLRKTPPLKRKVCWGRVITAWRFVVAPESQNSLDTLLQSV